MCQSDMTIKGYVILRSAGLFLRNPRRIDQGLRTRLWSGLLGGSAGHFDIINESPTARGLCGGLLCPAIPKFEG